ALFILSENAPGLGQDSKKKSETIHFFLFARSAVPAKSWAARFWESGIHLIKQNEKVLDNFNASSRSGLYCGFLMNSFSNASTTTFESDLSDTISVVNSAASSSPLTKAVNSAT